VRNPSIFLIALVSAFAAGNAHTASFDCARASTAIEKSICADPLLSRLDEQLDDAYRAAQKRTESRRALRDAQRIWLSRRRDNCRDATCLRAAYEVRIAALLDESNGNPTTETLEVSANNAREPYTLATGLCGGLARLNIGMADGLCAGLVAGPTQSDPTRRIRMPRNLLELDARTWLVTDLGAWEGKRGAVWRLRLEPDGRATVEPLIRALALPHTLAWGPDRRVYVSEMGRIFRFDPHAPDPAATVETVIDGLPDNRLHTHRHPIAAFLFDADGALLVNVGAPSDQCLGENGKPAGATCAESDTGEMKASLRRYSPVGEAAWSQQYTVHARGLRNSVALVRHSSGTVLQGENSYDFEARLRPFEEINIITAGRHYGWPYCYDNDQPTPGWQSMPVSDCRDASRYSAPALLLPPHSSPLAMVYYDGAMFPQLKGRLLMSWHGFRSVGGRIVAYDVDANGVPVPGANAKFPAYGGSDLPYDAGNAANALVLTPGWNKVIGLRPQGSPVGLTVARDGSIWTTDDRAGLVIRIAAEARQD
jgi:glucose/arabinose dehydrogenase/uncharacterized protein YecT (DUF1311 family)